MFASALESFKDPKRRRRIISTVLWVLGIVALLAILLFLLPKIVTNAIAPFSRTLRNNLSDVEIAATLFGAVIVLPFFCMPYYPFVWVVAPVMSFWACFLVTVLASAVSMMIMYVLGKSILHRRAQHWVQKNDVLRSVIASVDYVGPFKTQILLRLSLVPYFLTNYVSSIPESMTPLVYITASIIGWTPRNAIFVYFGKNLKGIAALLSGKSMPVSQAAINTVILAVSVLIVVGGYLLARTSFRKLQREAEAAKDLEAAAAAPSPLQQHQQHPSGASLAVASPANLSVAAVAVEEAVVAAGQVQKQA